MTRRTIAATAAVAALAAAVISTATATSSTHYSRLHAAGTPGDTSEGVGGSPELGTPVDTGP